MTGELDFTAIDVDTNRDDRSTVSAVAAVRVRNGEIVGRLAHVIDELDHDRRWPEIYRELTDFVADDVVVGHNAPFDISILLNSIVAFDALAWPDWRVFCTQEASRTLPISMFSLYRVAEHLELSVSAEPTALEDAETTASVLLRLAAQFRVTNWAELGKATGVEARVLFEEDAAFASATAEPDPLTGIGFGGHVVCFTGGLRSFSRDDAWQQVREHGGEISTGVTKKTTIVVAGSYNEGSLKPGQDYGGKLGRAFAAVDAGQTLEIMAEDQFLARLSLTEDAIRARRSGGARSRLPDYVEDQATSNLGLSDFWDWYRASLAHPRGRAQGGEGCVWCDEPIRRSAHWIHKDRWVCGVQCNERLKRSMKRRLDRIGLDYRSRFVIDGDW